MMAQLKLKSINLKYDDDFGEVFKKIRKATGLKQHEVGLTNNSVVSHFETETNGKPSIDTVLTYARGLGARMLRIRLNKKGRDLVCTRDTIGENLRMYRMMEGILSIELNSVNRGTLFNIEKDRFNVTFDFYVLLAKEIGVKELIIILN